MATQECIVTSIAVRLAPAAPSIPADGVDRLGIDAAFLKRATGIDVEARGNGFSTAMDIPATGTTEAVGLAARTVTADDGTPMLIGCAGIDASADAWPIPSTDGNALLSCVNQVRTDVLGEADAVPSTALTSCSAPS